MPIMPSAGNLPSTFVTENLRQFGGDGAGLCGLGSVR